MGKYFGTDGFRGEANVDLTAEHAYRVGLFLGWHFNRKRTDGQRARIVVGKDTRRSSYMLEFAICAGVVASGADVYLLRVTTTPSVAYLTKVDSFDCGVMISASHNPFYDNGIKLINDQGEKMDQATIDLVEAYLDGRGPEVPLARREDVGAAFDYDAGRHRYIAYLISLALHSFRGKKVGLDCANGAAWSIGKVVFEALGAKVYVMGNTPDGTNINRDCGSTHLEGLRRFVVEKGLDVGFAYDGDADRCLAVDEKGNVVSGDQIMYVYGKYMKERGKLVTNTVVTTVMSNFGLYKAFDQAGIDYVKTAVGDKYVYEYMSQHGNRLGGEQSGHIIFSKYATTGDGILTSIKVMEVMQSTRLPLSQLCESMTVYPQLLVNVKVGDKQAAQADPDVIRAIGDVEKALGNSGRILVRESGTEPLVRVMVEAETQELCQEYVYHVVNVIKAKGHEVK
ncbi:MAG: phosphoglucosamine mutase [Oscillospiraceae bacterium]|nr:phosphoglucosamine mutase [Oscillospiraceae bacterium]